jgi:hypothetical protein
VDLRIICLHLHQKDMGAVDSHRNIEATLDPDAIGHSTVTKYLREVQVTHGSGPTPISIEDKCQGLIDKAILLALAEDSFASIRRIASKTLIQGTTVYRHLVGLLGMTMKHLPWLPHRLSPQQKGNQIQKAQDLLAVLMSAKHHSRKSIITFDESFFYVHKDFEQLGLPRDEAPETRAPHDQL